MFKDVEKTLSGHILCDANAAVEVVRRKGIDTMRTLIQTCCGFREKTKNKDLVYNKVLGSQTPADLFTKYLSAENHGCASCSFWDMYTPQVRMTSVFQFSSFRNVRSRNLPSPFATSDMALPTENPRFRTHFLLSTHSQ